MDELSNRGAENEHAAEPDPEPPTPDVAAKRKLPTKKTLVKPPYVGIYIQCHGGFTPEPIIICPPPEVTLKKQSRGGYGCLTYGNEHTTDLKGLAIQLAQGTYKMSDHTEYEKQKMEGSKILKIDDTVMRLHYCPPGETCISSPNESSEPCWRVTAYSPYKPEESLYPRNAFQIYVHTHRHIDLWKCTDKQFKDFLMIDPSNANSVRIQTGVLAAIEKKIMTTVDLFNIIYILRLQGYLQFNIADHACHSVPVEGEYMNPADVSRGTTPKGTPWYYGGRKRKTKRKRLNRSRRR